MSSAEVMIPLRPSSLQWSTGIGPSKRLAENIVEIADEIQDPHSQIVNRHEAGAFEQSPREDGEPDFDLVQPRTMSWRIHEADPVLSVSQEGASCRARLQDPTLALDAKVILDATAFGNQLHQGC